jgi:hypothetical protein
MQAMYLNRFNQDHITIQSIPAGKFKKPRDKLGKTKTPSAWGFPSLLLLIFAFSEKLLFVYYCRHPNVAIFETSQNCQTSHFIPSIQNQVLLNLRYKTLPRNRHDSLQIQKDWTLI